MVTDARDLSLYLVDGSLTGVIIAELHNWSGQVLAASRSKLLDLIRRTETDKTGVYLLTGPGPDQGHTDVYVGEGDAVKTRLTAHYRGEGMQFFTRVYVVVEKGDSFTKTHGRYLESRILHRIKEAGQGNIVNNTTPDFRRLPEREKARMDKFLEEIELVLPVLGFKLFEGGYNSERGVPEQSGKGPIFEFTRSSDDIRARAKQIGDKFVVLAGSTARAAEIDSCSDSIKAQRKHLIDDGSLVKDPDSQRYVFSHDVSFRRPSRAASVVGGGPANGRKEWKVQGSGKTYGEWDESLTAAQEVQSS